MIYSTLYNKNTNEDPKTSTVFGNLMLLPDHVFWDILKSAAANKGILPDDAGLMSDGFSFWPQWDPNSKYDTGNSNYVEPDVFFRFDNIDVIVEAKYSDNSGQYRAEWEREFKAYLNMFEDDKKKVVLLAVGGNPTFEREPDLKVGKRKCPVVKYSWEGLLKAVLDFEKEELSIIEDEFQSSMKRIVKNVVLGCENFGIYKYNKKVEIKGLSNLFTLGKVFKSAIKRETETYTLISCKEDVNSAHYGYIFEVKPKDSNRESIWLGIAMWIDNEEVIAIEARTADNWAGKLCKQIEEGKSFTSEYLCLYKDGNRYYFEATNRFYQEFSEAETFDAQVDLVSKIIDDVCLYYLK